MKEIYNHTWTQTIHQKAPTLFKHNGKLLFICESSENSGEIKIFKSDLSLYREVPMLHFPRKNNVYSTIYGPWLFPVDCNNQFPDEIVESRILTDEYPSNDIVLRLNCKHFLAFLPNQKYLCTDGENMLTCKTFGGDTVWSRKMELLSSTDLDVSIVDDHIMIYSGWKQILYVIDGAGNEKYVLAVPNLSDVTYHIKEECFIIRGFDRSDSPVYREYVFRNGQMESNDLFSIENFSLSHFNLSESVGTLLGITEKNGSLGTICWNIEFPTYEFRELFFRRQKSPAGGEIVGSGDCVFYCEPHSKNSDLTLYRHGKCAGKLTIPGNVFEGDIKVFENLVFVLSFGGTDKLGVQTYRLCIIEHTKHKHTGTVNVG